MTEVSRWESTLPRVGKASFPVLGKHRSSNSGYMTVDGHSNTLHDYFNYYLSQAFSPPPRGGLFPQRFASLHIGLNSSALSGLFFNCQSLMVIFRVHGSAGTGHSPFEGGEGGCSSANNSTTQQIPPPQGIQRLKARFISAPSRQGGVFMPIPCLGGLKA